MNRRRARVIFWSMGLLLLLMGFGMMLATSLGPRIDSQGAQLVPIGAATVVIGALLMTRTALSVFFLALYALLGLVFTLPETTLAHPVPWVFLLLLMGCVPLSRFARRSPVLRR